MIIRIEHFLNIDFESAMRIYQEGIDTGIATFEQSAPTWENWDKNHLAHSRFVAKQGDEVVGWVALSPVSSRCVYGGVAEVSVYIAQKARGKGVGTLLLTRLIEDSEAHNIWTLNAGIFAENTASIELHKKVGFRIVGCKEKIGQLNKVWKDNLLLEKRSKIVGI